MNIDFNPVNATVTIAKEEVNPVSLILTQEYGEHHHFEITLDYDMYGDGFMSNPLKHIELIGRLVFIRFKHLKDSSHSYIFKGVATNVRQTAKEGKNGYLIISGSGPTIMLEKGKRMDIYSDKTLYKITKQIAERAYSDYLSFASEPVYENKVDFLMQYNESDWEFLKRLAYLYRENFFYDGYELKLGTFPDSKTVNLTYDREIIDLEFCSKMLPANFERYQYIPETDSYVEREVPKKIENSNDYLDKVEELSYTALNISEHSKTYMDTPLFRTSEISEILKREKSRNAAKTISIKGKSKTFQTAIGQIINIAMPEALSKTNNIGTYRVVKCIHRIDEKNRYTCEFEAIPSSLDTVPASKPKSLSADSIMGTIKSNEDPLNQGRVQVSFDFASTGSYAWLRVLTPNAGSSDVISQNRGMVFIPEVGDQVMIGFEYGDPNRPYVMGSLFHGKNAKGGGQNNAEKSIITRSGIKIVFNDDSGSLHIQDPSGNTWDMDGNGNIDVSAPKKIRFTAQDIEFNASQTINSIAGDSVGINARKRISTQSQNLDQFVQSRWEIQSQESLINTLHKLNIESAHMFLASSQKMFLHSDDYLLANSVNNLEMRTNESLNILQESQEYEYSTRLGVSIIDFRPHADYKGEYGFDWFRVGDIGEARLVDILYTVQYDVKVHNSPNLKTIRLDNDQAKQYFLNNAYKNKFTIGGSDEIYYIPKLTLYPKGVLPAFEHLPIQRRPTNKVILRVFGTINEDIASVTFDVSNPAILKVESGNVQGFTNDGVKYDNGTLTIECIDSANSFTDIEHVYAYANYSDPNKLSKLVGQIDVYPNANHLRQNVNILLIPVLTKIRNKPNDQTVSEDCTDLLYKMLYQTYTEANVIADPASIYLDLSNDYNFKIKAVNGVEEYGKFIYHKGVDPIPNGLIESDVQDGFIYSERKENGEYTFYDYLRKKFLDRGTNRDLYAKHQLVFQFAESNFDYSERVNPDGTTQPKAFTQGSTSSKNPYVAVMFKEADIDNKTLAHEFLHNLGLGHTFQAQKTNMYSFARSKTDNIMDYNNSNYYHTYNWQWLRVNQTLK